jgi:hypothetical protein
MAVIGRLSSPCNTLTVACCGRGRQFRRSKSSGPGQAGAIITVPCTIPSRCLGPAAATLAKHPMMSAILTKTVGGIPCATCAFPIIVTYPSVRRYPLFESARNGTHHRSVAFASAKQHKFEGRRRLMALRVGSHDATARPELEVDRTRREHRCTAAIDPTATWAAPDFRTAQTCIAECRAGILTERPIRYPAFSPSWRGGDVRNVRPALER